MVLTGEIVMAMTVIMTVKMAEAVVMRVVEVVAGDSDNGRGDVWGVVEVAMVEVMVKREVSMVLVVEEMMV